MPTDERSDKHELLLNNCSNKRRADGKRFALNGTAGGADYIGANAESVGPSPIEISSPMSQGFSFMRQKRAFLPDMQFQWSYTINPDFARDMFFSEFVPCDA